MKLGAVGVVTVLNLKEEKMNDGTKYYKMAVEQDGEAGSISCTEDVYKSPVEKYKEYELHVLYDDKYGRLRCIGIQPFSRSK